MSQSSIEIRAAAGKPLPRLKPKQSAAPDFAQLYKCRWQVELFFKWIKQHLRIKAFFGTNENAAKTQIWIAISVYCSSPSSKNVSASQRRSTQSYTLSASRFSRKNRWINCLTISLYKI